MMTNLEQIQAQEKSEQTRRRQGERKHEKGTYTKDGEFFKGNGKKKTEKKSIPDF